MKLLFICFVALSVASCSNNDNRQNTPTPTLGPNSVNTNGQLIEKLGERQSLCQQTKDQAALTIPEEYRDTVIDLLKKDQLRSFTFKGQQNCLRVGTEVLLNFDQGKKRYMGRAFVTSMLVSENSTSVKFDTRDRVYTTHIKQADQRLPSCRSRGDWTSFIIGKENVEEKVQQLKDGALRASIRNGALNCYRTNTKTYVKTDRRDKEERGYVVPSQLSIMHMSELTQAEADLVNMTLAELRQSLDAKKDRDGGFVNIIAFNYTPPEE